MGDLDPPLIVDHPTGTLLFLVKTQSLMKNAESEFRIQN
jgi:hypothetical protein